jgi:hypothetical protein
LRVALEVLRRRSEGAGLGVLVVQSLAGRNVGVPALLGRQAASVKFFVAKIVSRIRSRSSSIEAAWRTRASRHGESGRELKKMTLAVRW